MSSKNKSSKNVKSMSRVATPGVDYYTTGAGLHCGSVTDESILRHKLNNVQPASDAYILKQGPDILYCTMCQSLLTLRFF